ncbi:MAG: YdeI/OmpD-associated family protein [Candidatus Paceibacterota bacterium]|jgi:hypothetical protein
MTKKISSGTAHQLPKDLKKAIVADKAALEKWEDITPLARNEWICWTISVKQDKTRREHIGRVIAELKEGVRRPCCWSGCVHRTDKPMNATQKWIIGKQDKLK